MNYVDCHWHIHLLQYENNGSFWAFSQNIFLTSKLCEWKQLMHDLERGRKIIQFDKNEQQDWHALTECLTECWNTKGIRYYFVVYWQNVFISKYRLVIPVDNKISLIILLATFFLINLDRRILIYTICMVVFV